jgi:hypothetical protein
MRVALSVSFFAKVITTGRLFSNDLLFIPLTVLVMSSIVAV